MALFSLNPEELDLPEESTEPWSSCDLPDCTNPYEFGDEDGSYYCHKHMTDCYGPCGENCTSDENCPNHISFVTYLIEEGRWDG